MTKTGSIATYLKWKKETIQLPATVLDGYQVRSSGDPKLVLTGASSPSQLVDGTRRNDVIFVTEDELVQIRFPKPALVYTGRATLLDIPISNVLTVEKRDGPFDGHTAYGEPFYMPRDRALLLRDQTPGFSCAIKASAGDSYWVSYNEEVGQKDLQPLCDNPTPANLPEISRLLSKGKVFPVDYPSD